MQNKFTGLIQVKLYKIVLSVLSFGTIGSTALYFTTRNAKVEALAVGLATGLFIAVIQYLLDWNSQAETEAIKKLGIRQILAHRDDKGFYKKLIDEATGEICVLGNTASRLLEDFAHATRPDSRALLEALGRGAKVRILLPKAEFVRQEERSVCQQVMERMTEIQTSHANFEFRYFDHPPAHSLMRIDNECLVGPIFPKVKSKDSPAVQVIVWSAFIVEYLKYFEEEWSNAKSR